MTIEIIHADALGGVPHGFFGRRGGVSTGLYAGLNVGLGSDDEPAHVVENRRRAADAVKPGATLVTVHQVHSALAIVAEPVADDARAKADALVTDRPDLLIGVLAADCVPVLFADLKAGVVGAAHAGWKGAIGGVVASTVAAMEALGARRDRIAAAIGPCIARASYEVDDGFLARFCEDDPENERFFCRWPRRPPPVRYRSLCRLALRAGGTAPDRGARARYLCRTSSASSATAVPRIAASRATGGRSR